MQNATLISVFVASLVIGITAYAIFVSFGPSARNLRDPFEEHED
jgi:PsbN protein|uniref:Protein PsbN n=2 Tax=Cyanidioschyzon merolae TaxID=45157 RepID=PSBN_CYAM1|nr:photosystem II protein N [Cyanidioschyzon merolae strain 10D]Q85FZ3.1 RecName: Full=Protein PsbN [Cyanidioschyzon merolae strain 10D]QFV16992.1 photosystem II protein N [Cyanidioschyzon merolae]QFV17169.1 photosystem II protein N [Cyanidioschyzon merolae]BAC76199.1 photosystem II protein N [Cyanidioschyzon merolae strain 10D]